MADYNILMHQLNASGAYDNLYPKTKGGLVEGAVASANYANSAGTANSAGNANTVGGYNYSQIINNAVAQALAGAAKIQTGSYVGTGTYGPNNPNTLTFNFNPRFLYISPYFGHDNYNVERKDYPHYNTTLASTRKNSTRYSAASLLINLSVLSDNGIWNECLVNYGLSDWDGTSLMVSKTNNMIKWYGDYSDIQMNSLENKESPVERLKYVWMIIG